MSARRRRPIGGRLFACGCVVAWALGWSGEARAAPLRGSLHVTREAGAEVCPDEAQLRAQIEAALGRPVLVAGADGADVAIEVRVRPVGSGFGGEVRARGKREGERTLEDPGPGCDVLSGALAITIAILLEGDDAVGPAAPAPAPPPWYKQYFLLPAIDAAAPEEPPDDGVPPLAGWLGATYDSGRLDGDTGGVSLGVDVLVPFVTVGVSMLALPEDRRDLSGSSARFRYLGVRGRVCSRQPSFEQFGVGFCGLVAIGERTARLLVPEVRLPLDEQTGGYVGLGLMLDLSRRIYGPVGVYADFSLEFPVVADELRLSGPDGAALSIGREPAVFDLGLGMRFWLETPKER